MPSSDDEAEAFLTCIALATQVSDVSRRIEKKAEGWTPAPFSKCQNSRTDPVLDPVLLQGDPFSGFIKSFPKFTGSNSSVYFT